MLHFWLVGENLVNKLICFENVTFVTRYGINLIAVCTFVNI